MSEFIFKNPSCLNKSSFGGKLPSDNFRVKSLLLFLGQGSLTKSVSQKEFALHHSFLPVPFQPRQKMKVSDLVQLFPGYSQQDLSKFFLSSFHRNAQFHKNIFNELLALLGYFESNNHVSSFLYIYRLVEQIALCLPMLSFVNRASFQFTFNDYKQLIDNTAKSDLSVLRKFSENVLSSSCGNVPVRFDFSSCLNPKQNVDVLLSLIPMNLHSRVLVSSSNTSLEIKLKHVHIILISFRNEYFHYLFHVKNIGFDSLENPEGFLSVCNPIFINYIAQLYYELLTTEVSLWG